MSAPIRREFRATMPKPEEVCRGAVFFTRGLGDHILALPAMRALCQLFPGKLSLLVSHSAPDLFFGDAGFSKVVEADMDFYRVSGPLYDVAAAAAALGSQDLLLSIIPGADAEWTALAEALRPRWLVGVADSFSNRVPVDDAAHIVDQQFAVPRAFDASLRVEDFGSPFPLPAESVRYAEEIRAKLGGRKLLVVHAETKPRKRWEASRFRMVLQEFFRTHPEYAAIEISRTGTALEPGPLAGLLPLTGLPLASAIALAVSADLLLCVDSLLLHAADLWRTPTVALFGPTSATVWGARFNERCLHLQAESMDGIPVEAVEEALAETARRTREDHYRPMPLCPTAAAAAVRWK